MASSRLSFAAGSREHSRLSAGSHASTSVAACRQVCSPGHRRHRHHRQNPPLRGCVRILAKRRSDEPEWNEDDRPAGKGRGSSGFQFSNRRGMYRIQYNEYETEVRHDEAWKLLFPVVGALVLGASVIGPLVIGLAFAALAIGAALSAGAIFTSLFLPFFIMIGMGSLFFFGATFSAFATLGTALLLPKLIAMAVMTGGLGLGAMAVSLFLRPAADKAKASYKDAESRSGGAGKGAAARRTIDVAAEPEEARIDPEVDRQLREFDDLLADREEQRQRTDRWKGDGSRRR